MNNAVGEIDESVETDVIKAILLREEYIGRLQAHLESQVFQFGKDQAAFDDLLGLLDLLRFTTVDAVEAIQRWRRARGNHSAPFSWNSVNYLLKIPSDLDFVHCHKSVRTWLNFDLRRNPFLLPMPLERLADVSGAASQPGHHTFPVDKNGFFSVGGAPARAKTDKKVDLGASEPTNSLVGGSAIADTDMVRMRGAAAVIVQEEATHGRYTMDRAARFLPVGAAEKCEFSRELGIDDDRGVHIPAFASRELAPFVEIAGIGRVSPVSSDDLSESAAYTKEQRDLTRSFVGGSASGKANAKRTGGKLRPVSVTLTSPRKRAPMIRRSVGSLLRAEMVHRKKQNKQLQEELERLRRNLSKNVQRKFEGTDHENSCYTSADDSEKAGPRAERLQSCLSVKPQDSADFGEVASKLRQKSEEIFREARQQVAVEEQYLIYRATRRDKQEKHRAKLLERKRRLLEVGPNLGQPEDDDEYTLEDDAATQIQRIMRGVHGRTLVRKLRPVLNCAALMIQSIIRGHLGRARTKSKMIQESAVSNVQRVWRGYRGRRTIVAKRLKLRKTTAIRRIQKILRGRHGRQRVNHKRGLRKSARDGSAVVGVKQLFHQDIVELADAVEAGVVEYGANLPPGVILGLLKVVALMLEEGGESGAITRYSALGVRSAERVQPAVLFSWREALILLRRSYKLLRRLRQIAEGPSSTRPRIIYFSQSAVQTYAALRCDFGWNLASVGRIGRGAKACQHLMMWVDAMQEVFAYQREFCDDLGSDRFPWVARAWENLRCMRNVELSRMVWEHAATCLQRTIDEAREKSEYDEGGQLTASEQVTRRKGDLRLCVVEKALTAARSRESCAKDALCRMKQEEEDAQTADEAQEQLREETLVEDLRQAEARLTETLTHLEEAKKVARDGIETDQVQVQLLMDEQITRGVVRRECWTSLEMFRTQKRRNVKWRGVHVEVWGDLRHQVRAVGDLEAVSLLAAENLTLARDESDPKGDKAFEGPRRHNLASLQAKKKDAESAAAEAQKHLDFMEEEQETTHAIACEAEAKETVLPHEWDDPSEEEREEDVREDELCARRELEAATQFVPPTMILRPFNRPRPIVICLSRDLPAAAKKNVLKELLVDLPGLIIHTDKVESMGLHIGDLQQAISTRSRTVCNVDVGIGERCRKAFLQRVAVAKEALVPTPSFILVVGDRKNRSGSPLDSSVGCSGLDLSIMEDGATKQRLEDVARIVKEIRDPAVMEAMVNLGQESTPPSQSHALVMEVLLILLSPQTIFRDHIPCSSLSGVTWTEAQHVLVHPDQLCTSITELDAHNVPRENISALQGCVRHNRWPCNTGTFDGYGGILDILATWSSSIVELSVLLADAGGPPEALHDSSSAHAGLLASVIPVFDVSFGTKGDQRVNGFKRGWRAAYHRILTAVLEDVRVFRAAKRVRGSNTEHVHLIEIYQECGRLFFHTYDPESCGSSFCVVEESEVSHLLAPALDQPPECGHSTVPCDRQGMFECLVELLRFEEARTSEKVETRNLVCQRRLRRLLRDPRRVSGHLAQVTVYEEAKGELRYSIYLAHHAARIQLRVGYRLLEKVLGDSSNTTGERQAIISEDASRLLVPITDRLAISPSHTAVATMNVGRGIIQRDTPVCSQGFVLKIRSKGGPGRRVLRAVCLISRRLHVITAWELGRGGLLRVAAYDPTTSMTYAARISKAERACLGLNDEDRKSWMKRLHQRVSLRRASEFTDMGNAENRGNPFSASRTMTLDKTVFSTAWRLAAGRIDSCLFRVRAELVDGGRSLALHLYHADTSKQCRIVITEGDLAAMGLQPCVANADSTNAARYAEQDGAMSSMIAEAARREITSRKLMRQLHYVPDCESVVISVGQESRTTVIDTSICTAQRRPQVSLRVAFPQPAGNEAVHQTRQYDLVKGFVKQRHQPRVLVRGDTLARARYCREAVGKNEGPDPSPRYATSKRKKGKHKRDRKGVEPNPDFSALSGGNTTYAPRKTSATNTAVSNHEFNDGHLEHDVDLLRSISGIAPICLPRDGECVIFRRAVSVKKDDWERHQPVCDTIITVFHSSARGIGDEYPANDQLHLRAAIYYSKLGAHAEVNIDSYDDLRQVVGPLHQSLAHEWRRQSKDIGSGEALFNFIFHDRAMIVEGTWDGDRDEYVKNKSDFTVVLKRSRLYRSFKQTPVHLSGEQDAQANTHQLIDNASCRGKKVFRRAATISRTLFQLTAYEIPSLESVRSAAPTFKFIAYDPKAQKQLITVIGTDAVLELGGGPHSPWMARDKREVLAEIVAQALRLKIDPDGAPYLVVSWSAENLVFMDEVEPGETTRPRRDKVLVCAKRKGLSRLEVFSTRVTNVEVVITVLAEIDALSFVPAVSDQDGVICDAGKTTLTFNLYCPKLSESFDVYLPHAMQEMMTGRPILHIPKGEARSTAIRRIARFLLVTVPPLSPGLRAEFVFKPQKPWLVAYNELEASEPSCQRSRGQPLLFVPGDTDGDLITSKGISIGGLKVLFSAYTKEKGRPGMEGLVLETYNQDTSVTSTMHLSASALKSQVEGRNHLLDDSHLLGTIDMLTKRLLLRKSAVGGWDLSLDKKIDTNLFVGL
ncbi:unnamed protein product [Scytosiphon promiscuus]